MAKLKIIMYRDLSGDENFDETGPDKFMFASYYNYVIARRLEQLEDECCEHDFYYVVEVEIEND